MSADAQVDDRPLVLRDQSAGVLTLTLNRGERFNPLSSAMIAAVAAERGMFAHFGELIVGERARLVEDVIGNSHLANVVKRRQAREQFDPFAREIGVEVGVHAELLREQAGVLLRPA